jgi:hypothetical protein
MWGRGGGKAQNGGSPSGLAVWATRYWAFSGRVVSHNGIRWAVRGINAYKLPGKDGIFLTLLQEGQEATNSQMMICGGCTALGYSLLSWRAIRVIFIPKRISLNYFLFKNSGVAGGQIYTRLSLDEIPIESPSACIQDRQVRRPPFSLIYIAERVLKDNVADLGAFLNNEDVFCIIIFAYMCRAAEELRARYNVVRRIHAMLSSSRILMAQMGLIMRVSVRWKCMQGGILTPLF